MTKYVLLAQVPVCGKNGQYFVCSIELIIITPTWSEGVFKPTGEVKGAIHGKACRVFSYEELLELTEGVQWLRAAEPAFEFWNNDDAAACDHL